MCDKNDTSCVSWVYMTPFCFNSMPLYIIFSASILRSL
jgi:hypothetical protein